MQDLLIRAIVMLLFAAAAVAGAADCASLSKASLPDTSITTAVRMEPGTFTPAAGEPVRHLPAFCRVAGVIKPSADSNIQFEVWMPASGWNGKFQGAGNGGFAGSISYDSLAMAVTHNYATASTDTGHHIGGAGVDASWALG